MDDAPSSNRLSPEEAVECFVQVTQVRMCKGSRQRLGNSTKEKVNMILKACKTDRSGIRFVG